MRASGILLHLTSLPSPYGIGTMGKAAYEFVDFLSQAGQAYWQILPLGPTGSDHSPYRTYSAFAGDAYLIDLDLLQEDGLLTEEEIQAVQWSQREDRIDFEAICRNRQSLLYQAYERFIRMPNREFVQFVKQEQEWLQDYALFMALREQSGGQPWAQWDTGLRAYQSEAVAAMRQELKYKVAFHYFLQFIFRQQWNRLRSYANRKGIRIIGDVPIYVPYDSADVWAHREQFQLDADGRPAQVAGCPPDAFSEDGQLWGNPLYDWDQMRENGYDWWMARLRMAAGMYDVVRLDHFRGLESYWAVPYGEQTAKNGRWLPGPGMDFITALRHELPQMRFLAEDLGFLTEEAVQLRRDSGFPGMKVLQFAFDSGAKNPYLPHNYTDWCVCYTGTHDNPTLQQWIEEAPWETQVYARRYLGLHEEEGFAWGVLRGGMGSVAMLFMAQMQDYLGLGAAARMNVPGVESPRNWRWRLTKRQLTPELAQRIADLTRRFGRAKGN